MPYQYNNEYILKNNSPYFPIMGEIHYSRYPKQYWRESLLKMKAGGVDVVSSYVIWIHHEEIEGTFDFTGNKELGEFLKTCKECGLEMFLRIGAWCHGEVRNGGFPDWLLKKGFVPRTNDDRYFSYVQRFYSQIYQQAKSYLYKNGGPVIGIQIENEYGHCGGLKGEEGERHMTLLYNMALELGFDVPLCTATGWGGAIPAGLLPVMGGYCEAPWARSVKEIAPSVNYIFTYERNDHNIGSDLGLGVGLTFDTTQFPFLTAELGGGLQVTHHRRPVATARDIGAMTLAKLGSGVNLLGYYMYHGGTNPMGKLSALQESKVAGDINDLPVFSYDFNAPIREYGQMSDTLKELKLYALFAKDFGKELCLTKAVIPEENPLKPENLTDMRYSYRVNGGSGYLFVNNYQRRRVMEEHKNVNIPMLNDGSKNFPVFDLRNGDHFFCPYNQQLGNTILEHTLATPLCKLNIERQDETSAVVFYSDREVKFKYTDLPNFKTILLSRREALDAWKFIFDKEYLFICEDGMISDGRNITIFCRKPPVFYVFPRLSNIPDGFMETPCENGFFRYDKDVIFNVVSAQFKVIMQNNSLLAQINLDYEPADDIFVEINYIGDRAKLYIDNQWVGDHFYTGQPWEIGLKRYGFPKYLEIEIEALLETDQVFLETIPHFQNGKACDIIKIIGMPELYETICWR